MGHDEVFPHVGEQVRIQAPNRKRVAPLVTGTFGSSDFTHSLLGGAVFLSFFLEGFQLTVASYFCPRRGDRSLGICFIYIL